MKLKINDEINYKLEIAKKCLEGYKVLDRLELVTFGDLCWNSGSEKFEAPNRWTIGDKADRVICAIRKII